MKNPFSMNLLASTSKTYVLTSGKEIQASIISELSKAKHSVKVAMAWFTDPVLLQALEACASKSVEVTLVIADNEENTKLDFGNLESNGAKLKRIANKGYGLMHQKYCIIDDKIAITGSYNWTNNALKNNNENAVFSKEKEVLNPLVSNFTELMNTSAEQLKAPLEDEPIEESSTSNLGINTYELQVNGRVLKAESDDERAFIDYLNQVTTELIDDYDVKQIEDFGRSLASQTHGNPATYSTGLDQIYNEYRKSLSLDDEKKRRCVNLLKTAWDDREGLLKEEANSSLRKQNAELEQELSYLDQNIRQEEEKDLDLKQAIRKAEDKLGHLKSNKSALKAEEDLLKDDMIIRPFTLKNTWYIFVLLAFLATYLMVFYSSALYILLHAKEEATKALLLGQSIPEVHVFMPEALWLILDGGFTEIVFFGIFFIIPLAMSLSFLYTKKIWVKVVVGWILAVFTVDIVIAMSVSSAIHDVNLLAGRIEGSWDYLSAFGELNFWKVLIFGALPMMLFKLVSQGLHERYLEGNIEIKHTELKHNLRRLKEKGQELAQEMEACESETKDLVLQREQVSFQIAKIEEQKQSFRRSWEDEKLSLEADALSKLQRNKRIYEVFNANINSASSALSKDRIIARMASYLQGWHLYLSEIFSREEMDRRLTVIKANEQNWIKDNLK